MNFFSKYFQTKFLIPVFVILCAIYIYGLFGRIPDIDDAWIGEYAYWLAKDGYAHSELMRGINLQETKFVVHHKLFILHGALFINLFGFSVYTLKLVTLLYFVFFIILFIYYTRKWKRLFNREDLWFSLILIFSFPYIFKFSFIYRPEIMMMTYGFVGFILLEKYLKLEGSKFWQLFLAGIFFGLTMATHLNGLILVVSAFLLILWNKRFLAVFGFGIAVLLAFSIYFFDISSMADLELWQHQFFDSPSLDSLVAGPKWLKPIVNLIEEHIRYFHNPKIIFFSIFILFTLGVGFNFLKQKHTNLLRFAFLVAFITGIVAMHKAVHYLLLNFPYFVILVTLTIKNLKEEKADSWPFHSKEWKIGVRLTLSFLFILFLLVSTLYNIELAVKKFKVDKNQALAEKYIDVDKKTLNIVAPMTFIFNEIEHFKRIQGDLCYYELQKLDPSIRGEGLLRKAETFDISLMMISKYYFEPLGISEYEIHDTIGQFHVFDKNDELLVFKRLQ